MKQAIFTKFGLAAVTSLILVSGGAIAQSVLPDAPDNLWQFMPTIKDPISQSAKLGSVKIDFSTTTLANVVKAVGVGKIIEDDVENTLCYLSTLDGKTDLQIRISSGENSGLEVIDAIDLLPTPKAKPPKNCAKLPAKFTPLIFDRGLKLGIDDANVKALYGNPSGKEGNWVIYSHTHMIEDAEETGTITIRYNKGKADYIGLVKTISQ